MAIGHLGSDATIKDVNGKKVINFSVAHTETWKDKQDVEHSRTTWIECAMWEKEKIASYLKKGTQVYIEGTPTTSVWGDKNTGELKASLKMNVFALKLLGGKKQAENAAANGANVLPTSGVVGNENLDDLPF